MTCDSHLAFANEAFCSSNVTELKAINWDICALPLTGYTYASAIDK